MMATPTNLITDMPPQPIRRLSVQEYIDMHRLGILTADDRLQLLEGWLVEKMGKNPPHIRCFDLLFRLLLPIIPPLKWTLHAEAPIRLGRSVPEPDFSIVRGTLADYAHRLATGDDTALVIEISDATLVKDRTYKVQLYAGADIPLYWLINLAERQIECYTDPDPKNLRYGTMQFYGENETLPLVLEGQPIALLKVADMLP